MTAAKPGDRVRVTFVGDYYGQTSGGRHRILTPGNESFAPVDAVVEVLAPPITVGDVITSVEQLDQLGHTAVVIAPGGLAAQLTVSDTGRVWRTPGSGDPIPASSVVDWSPTVLHVGRIA